MQETRAPRQSDVLSGSAADAFRVAEQLRRTQAPDAAAVVLRSLLKRFPGHKKARTALAEIEARPPALPRGRTAEEADLVQRLHAATAAQRHGDMLELGQALLPAHPDCALLHGIVGVGLAARGRHQDALGHYQRALQLRPDHAEAAFNLGVSLQALGQNRQAIAAYGLALRIDPARADAYNNIGALLQDDSDHEAAVAAFDSAIAIDPSKATFHANRGIARKALGQLEEALGDFETALKLKPDELPAYIQAANAMKSMGRMDAARACLRQALQVRPDDPTALEALAQIVPPEEAGDLVATATRILGAAPPDSEAQLRASYALAELRFRQDHDADAMAHLAEAGRIGKRRAGFTFAQEENLFRASTAHFAPGPDPLPPTSGNGPTPIFILGMPRSGTSLVEEILSAHSRVWGAGELETLRRAVLKTGCIDKGLSTETLADIRDLYLAEALPRVKGAPAFFTDKMPINFRFLGHIAAAFPEAKIIHTNRTPEAVCWSAYRIHFPARGMAYAFDQRDVARMMRLHDAYMDFWRARFPGRIVELDYEALTEDPEPRARALLDALGLDWEDGVLDFHQRDRAVRTASAGQVRQAIYTGSSGVWRRFEPWLGDMLDTLRTYAPPDAPALP